MAVTTSQVQQLYIAYFNRPADFFGLTFQTAQANQFGLQFVADQFSKSPEYLATYAGKGVGDVIDTIYVNLFGRHAEPAGLKFWGDLLSDPKSGVTIGNAAITIANGAINDDKVSVANKLTAANAFYASLDTSAKIIGYSGDAANQVVKAWLSGVTSQATLDASITPAALLAVETAAIIAHDASTSTTFPLTTGVDTQTANVFNALLTASPTTSSLNSFDNITGKSTGSTANNVLNISSDGSALPVGLNISNIQSVNFTSTADQSANIGSLTSVKNLNITQVAGIAAATAPVIVTAGAGTSIIDSGVKLGAGANGLTINGGAAVTATASGADTAGALVGNVAVNGATGDVSVTVTESVSAAGAAGNIAVNGGANVAVNSTVNAGQATAASTGTVAAGTAGTITVSGATASVTVNNNTNVTDAAADTITGDSVAVTGGTTVTVNNAVTASAAANATALANAIEGAVTVLDGGTATSVTVNNAVSAAAAATPGVPASAATPGVAGGPGFSAIAGTSAAGAVASIPGAVGVTAGVVAIAGASAGHAFGNVSTTITSATINNYANGSYINSSALQSLTLSGAGAGFTIDNVGTTPITALALNLNGLTDAVGIIENGAHIQTLNVTTGGTSTSTIASFADASLKTLNIAGTQTLKMTTVPSSLTAIAVSGAAGFSGNVAGLGAQLASFTTTSSGTIKATLDATTQTFVGSTGTDVITIGANATKSITGGSASNNEVILSSAASTYTAAGMTKVTGFTTLGVSDLTAADVNVYDMKNVFTGFNAIDVISGPTGAGSSAFTNVKAGTTLAIDSSLAGTGSVAAVEGAIVTSLLYQVADATGSSDSVNLSLGTTGLGGITVAGLMLEDANAVGIATLNVTTRGTSASTITTLIDNGLSNLNVSGAKGLTIGTLNEATTQATAFNISNTSGGTVTISTLTDANLGSLSFGGSGNSVITNLTGVTGHILSIANSGTGKATIANFATDASLNSLTITGNVALNGDSSSTVASTATGATNGVTVSAGTDNAHINLTLTGAAAGSTDSITVGNANNLITDLSTAGTVSVTVGTGANLIDVHTGGNNATYSANVTLGAHTNTASLYDMVNVSVTGAQTAGFSTTITGALTGDVIAFTDAAQSAVVTLSAAQQTAITNAASLSAAIALAFADTGVAHNVTAFTYGGDTYVVENVGADVAFSAGVDSVIHLVGVHTISQVTAAGHATVAIAS